ncbi:MAG: calcium/sodium antiporter [Defluviitaleaceae bacterium]|nr:calcium/sodium antiporter [Defluviitaleaceae bacterium]
MTIALHFGLLVVGFVILIQAAKFFVDASVNIATKLKIPRIVVGLTIMAMGTSAPEAVISASAAVRGIGNLAVANAVGSNIFNLLFIVGLCTLIFPINVNIKVILRDYWVSVSATIFLLVGVIFWGDVIPRYGAFILLTGFVVYLFIVVRTALKNRCYETDGIEENEFKSKQKPLWKSIVLAVFSIGLIVGGGQLTVYTATELASALNISERLIGLTVVAMGTSLPELVTTIIACKRGEGEFALGFIIGSSVFNIMFVLGLAGLITPLGIESNVLFDLAILTIGTLAFYPMAKSGSRIVRKEGLIMTLMYALYMTWILIN